MKQQNHNQLAVQTTVPKTFLSGFKNIDSCLDGFHAGDIILLGMDEWVRSYSLDTTLLRNIMMHLDYKNEQYGSRLSMVFTTGIYDFCYCVSSFDTAGKIKFERERQRVLYLFKKFKNLPLYSRSLVPYRDIINLQSLREWGDMFEREEHQTLAALYTDTWDKDESRFDILKQFAQMKQIPIIIRADVIKNNQVSLLNRIAKIQDMKPFLNKIIVAYHDNDDPKSFHCYCHNSTNKNSRHFTMSVSDLI